VLLVQLGPIPKSNRIANKQIWDISEESTVLWMINLNEEFGDDGQQFAAQIRLRIEVLLAILEEIEAQKMLLNAQRGTASRVDGGSEPHHLIDRCHIPL